VSHIDRNIYKCHWCPGHVPVVGKRFIDHEVHHERVVWKCPNSRQKVTNDDEKVS